MREGAVFRVGGGMPSKGDGARALTPIDRLQPIGTGGTPITCNASEVSIGDAAFTSKTICRSSVFFFAVANKDFYDRSLTYRLDSSPRAETVMCRLPALSAYHRLAFPGLGGADFRNAYLRKLSDILQYRCLIA